MATVLALFICFPHNVSNGPGWRWGTASPLRLNIGLSSFDSKGILVNAWLANFPQLLLSMVYFGINRLCTSYCFTQEWNSYAKERKGLRVTDPVGAQRKTHFLQLPYRWSIPLTLTMGILHWLLSQSLFLVRLEVFDLYGNIKPEESQCTCGYSPFSLLIFAILFLLLLLFGLGVMLTSIEPRMPMALHCSLAISAACHPPDGDELAHLKEVQWGAVAETDSRGVGHCTFSSGEVSAPKEGSLYA